MKSIANKISIGRIFLVLTLLLTKPFSIAFYAIYLIGGISDVFDGYIARKTDTATRLGEKLDSVADLMMVVILTIIIYPSVKPTVQIIAWIGIIGMIRAISIIVVVFKYKTFLILHTYANKITGFLLFLFPMSFALGQTDLLMYIICLVASISSIEELLIHLLAKELRSNKKSLFIK